MAVNMTIMKKLYPDTIPELIYFPDASCTGVWRDDTIIFSHKYTECGTQREVVQFLYFFKSSCSITTGLASCNDYDIFPYADITISNVSSKHLKQNQKIWCQNNK